MQLDILLAEVIGQAVSLGIPVSNGISREVAVNSRAKTRFGRCIHSPLGGCVIEISQRVISAGESAAKEILAHEVLHSCRGCRNHGKLWKKYAEMMNSAFGYHIKRTSSCEELGIADDIKAPAPYEVTCQSCGAKIERIKKSPLITHTERYRCRCGGRLFRTR